MKQTTIDIIDRAMEFNTEIQEDNLNLQTQCGEMLRMCREMDRIATVNAKVTDQNAAELGKMCEVTSLESYSAAEKKTQLQSCLKNQYKSIEADLAREMQYMINCSLADLNRPFDFLHFSEVTKKDAILFNYYTVESMSTCFSQMLQSLGYLGNQNVSYEEFKKRFMVENDLNLLLTGTTISDEDYVTIDIPQPRYQSTESAELDKEHLNAMGKLLNSIASEGLMKQLASAKYNFNSRLSTNRIDTIKTAHFFAQMIMAIKNSILLMKNYNTAALNELQ